VTNRLSWSDEVYRLFGLRPQEFAASYEAFLAGVHPDDRAAVDEAYRASLREGRDSYEIEHRIVRRDSGEVRFVREKCDHLRDASGRTVRSIGMVHDITERKEAEEILRQYQQHLEELVEARTAEMRLVNEALAAEIAERRRAEEERERQYERLLALINATPDIICFKDGEGRWLEANTADLKLFELEGLDYRGKTDRDLAEHTPFYREAFLTCAETDEAAWTSGGVSQGEEAIPRPDGGTNVYDVIKVPLFHQDGSRKGLVVLGRDITQRVRAEEQLRQAQKMETIGRLAGGVAHDFNNLLAVIVGYGELMLNRLPQEDKFRQKVQAIVDAGRLGAGLTRQLLIFSRRQTIQPEVLRLKTLVADMEKMLRRLIGEDIRFIFDLREDLGQVLADTGQMEQVVMNLVLNARDAMPQGGRLTIATANVDLPEDDRPWVIEASPGAYVLLRVEDTGCGILPQDLGRIFDPFFTTKEVGRGTGLGLATVYGIVQQSGGALRVESRPGGGTTFSLYLPRTEEETADGATEEKGAPPPGQGQLILLVEDEDMLRGLVAAELASLGYRVCAAADAEEALARVQREGLRPGLLLSDVVMPGMSGPVLAGRLRQLCPLLRVLFMSGYTDEAIARHGVPETGLPLISKPFALDELGHQVQAVLAAPPPA